MTSDALQMVQGNITLGHLKTFLSEGSIMIRAKVRKYHANFKMTSAASSSPDMK